MSKEQPQFDEAYLKNWAEANFLFTAFQQIRTLQEQWSEYGTECLDKQKPDKDVEAERERIIAVVEQIKPYLDNEGIDYYDKFLNHFRAHPPTFELDNDSYVSEATLLRWLRKQHKQSRHKLAEATPPEVIAIQMLDSTLVKGSIVQGKTVESLSWS